MVRPRSCVIYVRIQRNNFFIARRGAKSINEIELFMGRIIGGHLIALLAFPNLLSHLFRTCAGRPFVHSAAKIITQISHVFLNLGCSFPRLSYPAAARSMRACNRIIDSRPKINSRIACRRRRQNKCARLALSMYVLLETSFQTEKSRLRARSPLAGSQFYQLSGS